ncbi:MAG: beta-lactamase family protein [Spirochaetia bacterium]|nr:beta-lactamase family protein [Spirochaetia bacterium]
MKTAIALLALLAVTFCSKIDNPNETPPGPSPEPVPFPVKARAYWPTADWRVAAPDQAGMDAEKLKKLDDYLFTRTGDDINRKGVRTDGVVIVRDGKIVFEKYARGYTQDSPHLIWSSAKSFTSALVGIAIKEGRFSLTDPISKFYADAKEGMKSEITVEHILQMSSGLAWSEGYEASPLKSSVIAMLYTSGRTDMGWFTSSFPLKHRPGTRWYYSSGDTNMLCGILHKTMSEDEYQNYPWEKLFNPIGMKRVTFERDGAGNYVGSSYLYAPPRELAKFGFLYLNDGMWEGKRVLPEGWVKYSRTLAPALHANPPTGEAWEGNYGAQWWMNQAETDKNRPIPWPDGPPDAYAAMGHWGQRIYVIPSLDIVAVRVGDDREKPPVGGFSDNEFLKLLKEAAQGAR